MTHGPIDFIMIGFEDSNISPGVADGIKSLIQADTIRIIDLVFVERDDVGELRVLELTELGDDVYEAWNSNVDDMEGMLTVDDAMHLASDLPANRSAVLALYENVWARHLSNAIVDAKGEVLANMRIPRSVISELEVYEKGMAAHTMKAGKPS